MISVIEFMIGYWDWYLLFGLIFGIELIGSDRNKHTAKKPLVVASLLVCLLWPYFIISKVMR